MVYEDAVVISNPDIEGHYSTVITVNCLNKTGLGCDLYRIIQLFWGLIYTGSADGWVKRVRLNDSVVENWVNSGGRPIGLILDGHKEVTVTDIEKGLLRLRKNGTMELLTNEAEGVKIKLVDGVDVADDRTIYFTDASQKYGPKWTFSRADPTGDS
ncbi:hypothetical protein CRG98_042218 [Punica granatum]|uniref:ACT domain-containing protein n=1 Tax=Punica granatum TaxID=22663 RepID=A0A2I0I0W1_PUNGR|nr:hypothetical protein CRG98_042218 [Punica granatum]